MRVFSGLRPSWYGELSRSDDSRDVVNHEHAQGRVNETYPHRRHTGGPPVRRNLEAEVDDASPSQGADGPGRQPEIQNQFDSGAVSPDRVGGCPDTRPMNQCDNASRPFDHPVQMGQVQSPWEMSAEYGYGANLAAWQGGMINPGAMMGPSAMGWEDPRYGRPNAHIYPSHMQHPYDSYIRAPMPYPYASQGMYHAPQGGPPSHYGYTPQMPSYPGQYGWTYVPGTHSLPTQGGSPEGQLASQGGSHVPPHPYSPGMDMTCYSPQIPGGFGPRHPMNHTTPGCGVQPQTAPEMTAQLSSHGGATPGTGEGSARVPIPGTSTPMARGPNVPNPTSDLGSTVNDGDLGVQISEAQVIQNPRPQVTQTPDTLGHLGETRGDPSAAVSDHVTLRNADAAETVATAAANATGSGHNALPGTSWSGHVSVAGVGGAPGPNVPTTNPGQGQPSAGDGSQCTRQKHKPDKYDGTSDWADYLRHFEMVSTWNKWGAEDKAAQLSMNLTGVARQAWVDTFCDSKSPVTYDALVTALTQRFKPEGQEEAHKVQFRNRFRRKDESFMEYGYALRRLAIRAFPQIKHEAREELIVDQFLQGLIDLEMRRHVSLTHPTSVDQAVSRATEYETVTQSMKGPPMHKPKQIASVQEVQSGRDISNLLQKVDRIDNLFEKVDNFGNILADVNKTVSHLVTQAEGKTKQLPQRKYRKDITCWTCSQLGHIARNCPKSSGEVKEKSVKDSSQKDSQTAAPLNQ